MKTLVLYKSKSGYTKNYASWISKELKCEAIEFKTFNQANIKNYDTIIYGGGLYAGGIHGLKAFKKLITTSQESNIVLYFTGASPSKSVVMEEITNRNFTEDECKRYKFFYFRGGFDFKKLSLIDKVLMLMLKAKIKSNKKKRELTADEKGMLETYNQGVDFTKANNIKPLLDYVNSIN